MIPAQELLILITNFEEVGFGASYLPEGIPELLVVDMGAVGDDLDGREDRVSIVVKDSQGPFDYNMTTRLIGIAGERNLDYAVDVFRHYGSDAAAAIPGRCECSLRSDRPGRPGVPPHGAHPCERYGEYTGTDQRVYRPVGTHSLESEDHKTAGNRSLAIRFHSLPYSLKSTSTHPYILSLGSAPQVIFSLRSPMESNCAHTSWEGAAVARETATMDTLATINAGSSS